MTPTTQHPKSLAWEHTPTQYNKKATMNATDVHHGTLFYTLPVVAKILGVSASTLRRWIKKGVINMQVRHFDTSGWHVSTKRRGYHQVVSRYDLTVLVLGRSY